MSRVDQLEVPLSDTTGLQYGLLRVSCLPNKQPPPLWDCRNSDEKNAILLDIQVLEDEEYVYRVETQALGNIATDKPELFMPDYRDGRTGRFRPGLNVGGLHVTFSLDGSAIGIATFEVLSKKIHYLSDYQAMLKNIASYLAEIIAERFAPAEQDFSPLESRDVVTLYQQFAFVRAFLIGDEFREAVRRILMTPDQHWIASDDEQPLAKGIRNPAGLVKALLEPGPRQPNTSAIFNSASLPVFVRGQTFIEDVDTPENRFIFHILNNWLDLAILLRDRLNSSDERVARQRGLKEVEEVIAVLEQILAANLFSQLGKLGYIPVTSTVLQRKEGYREIYRVFIQAQMAAQISWKGAEDVYGAGKKDVALLYEYWTFLTLAKIMSAICGLVSLNVWSLLDKSPDGLSLKLRQDGRFVLRGAVERQGKKINTVLFYNRKFEPSTNQKQGSWTREMKPDFSILIREDLKPEHSVWLHFDAKYKVDNLKELFGPDPRNTANTEEGNSPKTTEIGYKREDLLKMHAYKDAVRRSTGAFVLYPGTEKSLFRQFTEIVPGIGAFALRPTESGSEGAAEIEKFLSDVLDVFASSP